MQFTRPGSGCRNARTIALALLVTASPTSAFAQSDSTQSPVLPRNSWYPVPVVTKTEVAGIKLQGIMALLHRTAMDTVTRPSLLFATVAGTQNHQYGAAFGGDLWLRGNTRNVNFLVEYQKSPAPFYGIGPNTTRATLERDDSRTWSGQVTGQQALRPADYVQLGLTIAHRHMDARRARGPLTSEGLTGASGYTETAIALGLGHDTRTSTYFPRGGAYVQAQMLLNLTALGGSSAFSLTTLDARGYVAVTRGAILAVQGVVQKASGSVPFQLLPQLGGDALRAYEDGRWRDRALLRGQVEWRQQLFWRLRADLFAAAGAVAPGFSNLTDSPLRSSYGAGLRILVSRKLEGYFRGDYARGGDGTTALTIGWAEVF